MAIAVTVRRGDDDSNPIEAMTACHIDVTGLDPNEDNGDAIVYYLKAAATGADDLVSHRFQCSSDGKHTWDNVIFPVDGSWTISVMKVGDPDSEAATQAVTVAAAS